MYRRHYFMAFLSFYALKSPIEKQSGNVFGVETYLRPKNDNSDRTGHRIFQREVKKSPVSSRKVCELSRNIYIGYLVG
jgi:hypothetical protein